MQANPSLGARQMRFPANAVVCLSDGRLVNVASSGHSNRNPCRNSRPGRLFDRWRAKFNGNGEPRGSRSSAPLSTSQSPRTISDRATPRPPARRQFLPATSATRHCPASPIRHRECASLRREFFAENFGRFAADHGMRLSRDLRRGRLPRADRPHRFVGHDQFRRLLRRDGMKRAHALAAQHIVGQVRLRVLRALLRRSRSE